MDWSEVINCLLKLVACAICTVISVYVIPWLEEKRTEAQYKNYYEVIDKFVAAAEQLAINSGYDCAWKKQYVCDMVEKYFNIDVDSELDAYIESAVILLHKALYGDVNE